MAYLLFTELQTISLKGVPFLIVWRPLVALEGINLLEGKLKCKRQVLDIVVKTNK